MLFSFPATTRVLVPKCNLRDLQMKIQIGNPDSVEKVAAFLRNGVTVWRPMPDSASTVVQQP